MTRLRKPTDDPTPPNRQALTRTPTYRPIGLKQHRVPAVTIVPTSPRVDPPLSHSVSNRGRHRGQSGADWNRPLQEETP